MITIQAASVKELKAIFEEMFVSSATVVETKKAETPKPPKEKKIAPAVPETPVEVKVEVEIPDTPKVETPSVDYDTVLARIKRMKVTTHPSIIDLVNQWKTNQKFPSLKEMDLHQLNACSLFLDGLEA